MIVKNEQNRITWCLSNIAPLVDEMIVVDTGSNDNTIELAKTAGATVYSHEWQGNTAQARNFGLKHANYHWILVLDADETISKKDFPAIKRFINDTPADGFIFNQRHYTNDPDVENWRPNDFSYEESRQYAGFFDVQVIRLFRNRPDIIYQGNAHELVEHSLKDSIKKHTNIPIHHYGIAEGRISSDEKNRHYLSLLYKDLQTDPDSFKTHFLLGRQYYQLNNTQNAIEHLEKAVSIRPDDPSALNCLGTALIKAGQFVNALIPLKKAVTLMPSYEEPYYSLSIAYFKLNDIKNATHHVRTYLKINPQGVKGINLLGYIYLTQRLFAMACKQFQRALDIHPRYSTALGNLITALLGDNQPDKAHETAKRLLQADPSAKIWLDNLFCQYKKNC